MEQTEQNRTQLEQLDNRLWENSQSLHFKRVPPRIKREFVNWANKEFSGADGKGDYGMAFKWLWEGRLDAISIAEEIGELRSKIAALEGVAQVKEQPKVRRMVGGNTLPLRS